MTDIFTSEQLFEVREFNRFYTVELGLLRKRYLDGAFSLTEARALYEIAANPASTVTALCQKLHLDKGYVSRLLKGLGGRGLIVQNVSLRDAREKPLALTDQGRYELEKLNEQSNRQIGKLLEPLTAEEQLAVLDGLRRVRKLLSGARRHGLSIDHLATVNDDDLALLEEYFDTIGVTQRDSRPDIRRAVASRTSEFWVARDQGRAVGCVMLRKLEDMGNAGECKRLYVRAAARGQGIADALMSELESYARTLGLKWIYLDSKDDLPAALALYRKRGYAVCPRYNDNPQATVFMRKQIDS
jgi:DNA-binding MarR family transcriptional regulator/GNAT superfamily N-acetyltransferase